MPRPQQHTPRTWAFLYGERSWTYATFAAAARQRAQGLRAAALPPGSTVIAIEPMSDDLLLAFLACCQLGLVFCHLSPQYTIHEVTPLAARAAARLALTRDGAPHPLLPALPALPLDLPGGEPTLALPPQSGSPEEPILLSTTSGTTARLPKLAILPHRALTWRRHLPVWFEARPGVISTTTQSFNALARQSCIAAALGNPVLIPTTLTPSRLERELARAQVKFLTIQPAILRLLIDNPQPPPSALHLQGIRVGSAALPPALAAAATQRYGATTTANLSATECGQALDRPEKDGPPGTIGLPYPGVALRLVDRAGNDVPAGTQGEIIIQTPGRMLGYLGNPEATAAALRDGWFWTGDLAIRDTAGFYFLRGRRALQIAVSGLRLRRKRSRRFC